MNIEHEIHVNEALDAVLNAGGTRHGDLIPGHQLRRNEHKRENVRRLLLRLVSELPEDMTVSEIREALE